MKKPFLKSSLILAAVAGFSSHASGAVAFPYTTTFGVAGEDTSAGYYKSTAGEWVLDSVAGTYTDTATSTSSAAYTSASSVQLTGRGATDSFQMQTTFVYTGSNLGTYSFGFAALATTSVTTGLSGGANFYFADLGGAGALRIGTFTGATFAQATTTTTGTALGNLVSGSTYTMTLQGIYVGSALNLTLIATGNGKTMTITTSSPYATPLAGDSFGFRNRVNSVTTTPSSISASYQDFSIISIPEPTAALLLGGGLLGSLVRRRR